MVVAATEKSLYIDGEWRTAPGGKIFAVNNPATGKKLADVADGGVEQARQAIEAAHAAFPSWSATTADRRAVLLTKAAALMMERLDHLAAVLTSENGKPLAESRGEVTIGAGFLQWNAEEGRRAYGEVVPSTAADRRVLTFRQPVGVVAAITPWNFPFSMVTRKLGPALAAGCTAILRPARATPLVAFEIFKILDEVGFPRGVVNLLTGIDSAGVGRELATNPLVRKLTFTGSTEVGKSLLVLAAGTIKRVSLELGGHAPSIVFDDADLEKAATAVVASRFRNAGQTCICTNRVYVQNSIAAAFQAKVAAIAGAMKVGNGADAGVQIGPLIDARAYAKVEDHVADAVGQGARILTGGRPAQPGPGLSGHFYEPTVLSGATHKMKVMYEETFGPVLPIATFETEDEAIRLANDTPFGLAAYFYARDIGRVFRVSERLDYGIIGANDPVPVGPHIPFGGYKESGLGRENGSDGIYHFLETKAVSIGI
ncbi:MAG: NAD-dependent succinate-semialdehyde dehydrogenase [Chloroflexota bacterium]|nr:MAG: NAD-dependent succinate-semialdehyde dehydrogenase [Chloroflexota bacterium]